MPEAGSQFDVTPAVGRLARLSVTVGTEVKFGLPFMLLSVVVSVFLVPVFWSS